MNRRLEFGKPKIAGGCLTGHYNTRVSGSLAGSDGFTIVIGIVGLFHLFMGRKQTTYNLPGTCLFSILGFQHSKRRPNLHSKQGAPFGFQVYLSLRRDELLIHGKTTNTH